MGMTTVCILGVSMDDAVNISHGLVISGERPIVYNCDSQENLIYKIKSTWIIKIHGKEYRVGDEGDIVVNKPFNGLFYTGISTGELTGFLTREALDERIFIGLLTGFLLKGLELNDALQKISELYEYGSTDPLEVVSRRMTTFKCLDRLFDAVNRFLTHASFQAVGKGGVVFSCINEKGLSYEVELFFSPNYKDIVRMEKIQRISVKDLLTEDESAIVCFENPLFDDLRVFELDGKKWFCLTGKDPVRITVETEKKLNRTSLS
jgi:hypothetical protein